MEKPLADLKLKEVLFMKKYLNVPAVILILVLTMTGCNKNIEKPVDSDEISDVDNDLKKVVCGVQNLPERAEYFTEITSYTGDLDADGIDEVITLSTSAERNGKGEFIWNDGQEWLLSVRDKEDGNYILLNDFIQAGNVYFEVSDYYMKDGVVPKISVVESTGAGFSVINYTFSKEDFGYIRDVIFDTKTLTEGGINRRFSSFPDINK